jgi:predicted phosphoribosyltransferase
VAKLAKESAAQCALLEELKAVAEKLGLRVREERLLREVGYRVRSGSCRVRDQNILFLDRGLPTGTQIDILIEELADRALDEIYLSPAVRERIEGAARIGLGDGASEAHCG